MTLKTLDLSGVTKNPKNLTDDEELEIDISDDEDDLFITNTDEIDIADDDEDGDTFVEELLEDEDEELEEESEEGSDDEDDDDDDDEGDEEETFEQKKKSRAQERIRQLNAQKNEAKKSENEWKQKYKDLQDKYSGLQEDTVTANKTLLEQQKSILKKQLEQAHENSDTKALIDLQEQLSSVNQHLAAYDNWKPDELEEIIIEETKDDQQEMPEALEDWLIENPWFQNPKTEEDIERVALVDAYSGLLLRKGVKLDDPEFYETINAKLNKNTKEVASKEKKMVQSKKSSKKDVKKRKKVSQTVQGASRTSPTSRGAKGSRRSRKIELSPSEKRIADSMGLTHKEYADEKLRLEEAPTNGMSRMKPLKLD